jgi:hypothetical protein
LSKILEIMRGNLYLMIYSMYMLSEMSYKDLEKVVNRADFKERLENRKYNEKIKRTNIMKHIMQRENTYQNQYTQLKSHKIYFPRYPHYNY